VNELSRTWEKAGLQGMIPSSKSIQDSGSSVPSRGGVDGVGKLEISEKQSSLKPKLKAGVALGVSGSGLGSGLDVREDTVE